MPAVTTTAKENSKSLAPDAPPTEAEVVEEAVADLSGCRGRRTDSCRNRRGGVPRSTWVGAPSMARTSTTGWRPSVDWRRDASRMNGFCGAAALVLATQAFPTVASAPASDVECRADGPPTRLAALPEASGLAASRRIPNRLWAINDSGAAILFALDARGAVVARRSAGKRGRRRLGGDCRRAV